MPWLSPSISLYLMFQELKLNTSLLEIDFLPRINKNRREISLTDDKGRQCCDRLNANIRLFAETLGALRGQPYHVSFCFVLFCFSFIPKSITKLKTVGLTFSLYDWPDNSGRTINRFVLEQSLKVCFAIAYFSSVFCIFWGHRLERRNKGTLSCSHSRASCFDQNRSKITLIVPF